MLARQVLLEVEEPALELGVLAAAVAGPAALAVEEHAARDDAPQVVRLHQRREQRPRPQARQARVLHRRRRAVERRPLLRDLARLELRLVAGQQRGDVAGRQGQRLVRAGGKVVLAWRSG